jgi:alpha-L-rhamnosidase
MAFSPIRIFATSLCAFVTLCCAAAAEDLETGFRSPPHSSGIRCFWWWLNGNVTEEAITRDLEEMKAKGFNGALIFDADGSGQRKNTTVPAGPTFGSPAWTKLFVHACKEAKRLDLELSLNIQSGWNLGGPEITEEQTTQHLVWSRTTVEGPGTIEMALPKPVSKRFFRDVVVLAVPLKPGTSKPIDDLNLKSATSELGMSAPDCRPLLEVSPSVPDEVLVNSSEILNISDKMNADGMLGWTAPAGKWEILRIGHIPAGGHVSTQSAGWGGLVIDYLNPAALDAYWERNVNPLCKAIGPLAGTTLRYIHTDSWEGGGMNWTPGFDQTFRKNRGYDIIPWLAGHVVDSRESSNAFLADFRKTIGDLVANHYGRLAELSKSHGMVTHPECSGPHAGPLDGMKNYGRSELVMSEFWSPSPHRPKPESRFFVKQASSAAHTYGKRLVGAEGFTTIGPHWNDVPWSDMKPSFDTEFCAGLNLVFNHTFTCSPKEMGLPGQEYFAGTHFNPQITWWNEAPAFIQYLKRCQFIAQRGDFVADVVYYYGDHIPNIFGRKGQDPAGALPDFDYDVLSEELLLSDLAVKDGRLALSSGMRYRVLVLPDHRILSLGALKKIDVLVRAGATVLGPKPLKSVSLEGGETGVAEFRKLADGLWGKDAQATPTRGTKKVGAGRVAWGMSARELLRGDGIAPDLAATLKDGTNAPDIDWIHYRIGDAEVYFLAELAGKTQGIDAAFRVDGRIPELWDPVDGSIREASTYSSAKGITRMPLELGAYDSLFVVFRKSSPATERGTGANSITWQQAQVITGPWEVAFDSKWGGPAKPVRFETLTEWTRHEDPAIRHYSGKAIYRTRFTLGEDLAGKPLALELGAVKDVGMARVTVNGTDLGIVWRPPFRVNLGKSLKPGAHTLEIMVVNSWYNRLIADASLPEDQRLTKTNVQVTVNGPGKWQPKPSGLLGPVILVSPKP